MHKNQIDQMVRNAVDISLPVNIGDALLRAEHVHIGDLAAFDQLAAFNDISQFSHDASDPLLIHFDRTASAEQASVIMLVDGQDLDAGWLKRWEFSVILPPSFFLFAYSEALETWHAGALAIGRGGHPCTMTPGTRLRVLWLDGILRPPLSAPDMYDLQQHLGLLRLLHMYAFERLGLAVRTKQKTHTDFTITAHAAPKLAQ